MKSSGWAGSAWRSLTLPPAAATDTETTWALAFRLAWRAFWPIRLLLSLCGAVTILVSSGAPADRSLGGWLSWLLLEPWNRFDVVLYMQIAAEGYGIADGRASFHPLLPLLSRVIGDLLGGQYLLGGLLAANLACIAFLAALFRYLALDHGAAVAGAALGWALYLPVSFVLLIPYTEPLLLCFTLMALWYARHDRWLAAGLWACLAALTKQPGAALVLPLLWEYVARHRERLISWRSIWALACIGLGPLGYLGFSLYRGLALGEVGGGDPISLISSALISRQLGENWGTVFGWPWQWLWHVATTRPKYLLSGQIDLCLTVAGMLLAALALRRERATTVIYSLTQILLATSMLIAVQPLQSMPRRIFLAFPIVTLIAGWTLSSTLRRIWIVTAVAAMLGFAAAFSTLRFIP